MEMESSSSAATEEATDAEEDAAVRDDRRVARFGGIVMILFLLSQVFP